MDDSPAPHSSTDAGAHAAAVSDLIFNPMDPAFRRDPYPFYRRLREQAPLFLGPFDMPILSRYADCIAMLRHPRASSDGRNSDAYRDFVAQPEATADGAPMMEGPNSFLFMDPPDHTRLRGLVSKAFTPRIVEGLRPRIQQLVDDLIEAAIDRGSMELIEDLAYPLPVTVISEMLGVPHGDQATFKGWSRELASSLDPSIDDDPEVVQRRMGAQQAFTEYVRGLIARRRKAPGTDLLTALIAAEEEDDRLSEEELISTCILLLIAGHETTVNLIGNGTLALLRHPDQLARLRAEPALIASAIEETLRYDPPVQLTSRTALADIELPGGVIRKGQQALVLLAAANRDPAQFPDPDTLDIARADNRHIAFGMGIHFCLGAPLARVEGQLALPAIFSRLPNLQLVREEQEYRPNLTLRGLASLPLIFTPA